jgi:hypothetical protein
MTYMKESPLFIIRTVGKLHFIGKWDRYRGRERGSQGVGGET